MDELEWKRHFKDLCARQNGPVGLALLAVAALLLASDWVFADYPLGINLLRAAVTALGFASWFLFRFGVLDGAVMVLLYVIPVTGTVSLMVAAAESSAAVIQATTLLIVSGFIVIASFQLSPVHMAVFSLSTVAAYLSATLFLGTRPLSEYLAANGSFLILCYASFPFIALVRYRLLRKNFRLMREVEFYATKDPLTRGFNRHGGLSAMGRALEAADLEQTPLSLCFLDIDGLKGVNDERGHAAGDELIRSLTECIHGNIRSSDSLIRYGGDEFIILLPDCPLACCERILSQIRADAAKLPGPAVSFSCGMVEYEKGMSLEAFIQAADDRMYADKKKQSPGGNR